MDLANKTNLSKRIDMILFHHNSIRKSLGKNKVMILRNHGLLTCGETIGEAFILMYYLDKACKNLSSYFIIKSGSPFIKRIASIKAPFKRAESKFSPNQGNVLAVTIDSG